jgi:hypothetical protein
MTKGHLRAASEYAHLQNNLGRGVRMPYAQRIILHAPPWDSPALAEFVEACLRDRVLLICIIGDGCRGVEDVIDDLVVGDGTDPNRFLTTTSHPDESLDEVKAFAEAWALNVDSGASVQEVRLPHT